MTCHTPINASVRCGLPHGHPAPCLDELAVARRDIGILLETLSIAQTRGTELHNQVVALKAEAAEGRRTVERVLRGALSGPRCPQCLAVCACPQCGKKGGA